MHGLAIFEWDLRWSSRHDLLNVAAQKRIRGWLRSGLVRLVWLGTPCTTFTAMQNLRRGGPLRSAQYPWGVPGLPAPQRAAVDAGNIFLRFSVSVLAICKRLGIVGVMENPGGSLLWTNPIVQEGLRWKHSCLYTVDYCRYGTEWRKRTRLWAVNADLEGSSRTCQGSHAACSESGKPHTVLMGRRRGVHLTKLAESYPHRWCNAISSDLVVALRRQDLRPFQAVLERRIMI